MLNNNIIYSKEKETGKNPSLKVLEKLCKLCEVLDCTNHLACV